MRRVSVNRYSPTETKWLGEKVDYSGRELRSHFVREKARIAGDGVVAFVGACSVEGESLVDIEDVEAGAFIKASRMLHFIGEHFEGGLREGNLLLRLFASIVKETLEGLCTGVTIVRTGDDLFIGERKLTVAIVTRSPVSILFHFGVNIDPSGAPVPAVGIDELGVDVKQFADEVLSRYGRELESIELALRKVRGVR
jgi:hypothetical protein